MSGWVWNLLLGSQYNRYDKNIPQKLVGTKKTARKSFF